MEHESFETIVFRCSKCVYTTMESHRAVDHAKIKRCRGSDIWKELVRASVVEREILEPPAESHEASHEATPEASRDKEEAKAGHRVRAKLSGRVPSGLDCGEGIDTRIEYMQNPRIAKAIFQGDCVDTAVSMLRYLWGVDAPEEFRSIFAHRNAFHSVKTAEPLEIVEHRGMQDVRTLLIDLCKAFDRIAGAVTNRLYVKRAQELRNFLGGDLPVAVILSRDDEYRKKRRKTDVIWKIRLVQRLRKGMLDVLQRV